MPGRQSGVGWNEFFPAWTVKIDIYLPRLCFVPIKVHGFNNGKINVASALVLGREAIDVAGTISGRSAHILLAPAITTAFLLRLPR